jgi:acetyltransferase
MTVRNLDALFAPASVAVIGASDRAGSIGRAVFENLRSAGFPGPLFPVHEPAHPGAQLPGSARAGIEPERELR